MKHIYRIALVLLISSMPLHLLAGDDEQKEQSSSSSSSSSYFGSILAAPLALGKGLISSGGNTAAQIANIGQTIGTKVVAFKGAIVTSVSTAKGAVVTWYAGASGTTLAIVGSSVVVGIVVVGGVIYCVTKTQKNEKAIKALGGIVEVIENAEDGLNTTEDRVAEARYGRMEGETFDDSRHQDNMKKIQKLKEQLASLGFDLKPVASSSDAGASSSSAQLPSQSSTGQSASNISIMQALKDHLAKLGFNSQPVASDAETGNSSSSSQLPVEPPTNQNVNSKSIVQMLKDQFANWGFNPQPSVPNTEIGGSNSLPRIENP